MRLFWAQQALHSFVWLSWAAIGGCVKLAVLLTFAPKVCSQPQYSAPYRCPCI
ncbi:uncharacterized protein M421DRAFT_423596 [Didymella exigua CBS 183.55]|uniref:Uncharacterized protein n=1 Tax=Didymella exigua CBS 183.55 TaxID=1150837 RepID=A0A6A5RCT3_9PLEO|nr:uncharacterized protein M421DRAFT_423596 [Didymella exigua CBS 183.55]KAF1925502.1 hypothetical protein M421DRAFT_423596 [Didymella exigua CBS 183.55]